MLFWRFFQPAADFSTGLPMPLGASSKFVLVAKLGLVIADESALKQTYENKGASGKVPCLFCPNVLLKRYAPTGMDDGVQDILILIRSIRNIRLKLLGHRI